MQGIGPGFQPWKLQRSLRARYGQASCLSEGQVGHYNSMEPKRSSHLQSMRPTRRPLGQLNPNQPDSGFHEFRWHS
jgi:hypothetical protein